MKKSGPQIFDLSNQRFGDLTAMWPAGRAGEPKKIVWMCSCDCGNYHHALGQSLRRGLTLSCGCRNRATRLQFIANNIRHGSSKTPEYRAYISAKERCISKRKSPGWKNYAGRGIKFLFQNFEEFYACLGPKPTPKHSVDRVNNNGHYEAGNVRWATRSEQARNQRPRTKKMQCFGQR